MNQKIGRNKIKEITGLVIAEIKELSINQIKKEMQYSKRRILPVKENG